MCVTLDWKKLRDKLRDKQDCNTLRNVTDSYLIDFQLIKPIKSFVGFQICVKLDFNPIKTNVPL